MIDLLIILLRPALLCLEKPLSHWWLAPVLVLAWIVDLFVAHTTWALIAGWPKSDEFTVSDTLERLCNDRTNPDQLLFIAIAIKINRATGLPHIRAVT